MKLLFDTKDEMLQLLKPSRRQTQVSHPEDEVCNVALKGQKGPCPRPRPHTCSSHLLPPHTHACSHLPYRQLSPKAKPIEQGTHPLHIRRGLYSQAHEPPQTRQTELVGLAWQGFILPRLYARSTNFL